MSLEFEYSKYTLPLFQSSKAQRKNRKNARTSNSKKDNGGSTLDLDKHSAGDSPSTETISDGNSKLSINTTEKREDSLNKRNQGLKAQRI